MNLEEAILMRAMVFDAYGDPSVFYETERPDPSIGPTDVLVQVCASSVNPIDCKIRSGSNRGAIRYRLPHVIGLDASGVVLKVGSEVKDFTIGDEVFSSPSHRGSGCYAERVAIDMAELAHKPKNISHQEAASIPLVALTAWQCLMPAIQQQKDAKVFIQAGSGGVGTMAIQMAKYFGAWVATTCSEKNHDLVKSLGADLIIDYTKEDFDVRLRDEEIDIALDSLGGEERERTFAIMKKGGRLATIVSGLPAHTKKWGPNLGLLATGFTIAEFMGRGRLRQINAVNIIKKCDGAALAQIGALFEANHLICVIDQVYPMTEVAQAHAHVETGRARGKIVLDAFQ
jgi:alcohol dehydrogenase